MASYTLKAAPLPFSPFRNPPNPLNFEPEKTRKLKFHSSPTNPHFSISKPSLKKWGNFPVTRFVATDSAVMGDKLYRLVSEFESLKEPIDRVRRLLDYAARLPPFEEPARRPENKVSGCTTQVWLEVKIDGKGKMRFRGDSDSEITKGFISCLVWLLDGADPGEVAAVEAEELEAVNVGLYGKAKSRVNTWHNVLISMKDRTRDLIGENNRKPPVVNGNSPKLRQRWQELC